MTDFEIISKACKELLNGLPEAKDVKYYLESRASQEAIGKFDFGYFPTNHALKFLSAIVGEEILYKLNLYYDKMYYDEYPPRKEQHSNMEDHNLILPYKDVYGNVIALVGRTILDETSRKNLEISKYKNTAFIKGDHLFGLYEAKKEILNQRHAIIVEGQFDCITAHDNGVKNVVALGASGMAFNQVSLLSRYTDSAWLLLDNDEAGEVGRQRIKAKFGKYMNFQSVRLPDGYKDLDEYFSAGNNQLELNFDD